MYSQNVTKSEISKHLIQLHCTLSVKRNTTLFLSSVVSSFCEF